MIVIGSRALAYWFKDAPRQPKDYDFICTKEELAQWIDDHYDEIRTCQASRPGKHIVRLKSGTQIEFEYDQGTWSCNQVVSICLSEMAHSKGYVTAFPDIGIQAVVPSPAVLQAIKKSHLWVPLRRWDKHIVDYHFLKSKVNPTALQDKAIIDLISMRTNEAAHRLALKKVKLNMSNEAFFKKSEAKLNRYFVHDEVHQLVAYYDKPLFTYIKRDLKKATCDRMLFLQLSPQDRLRAVREEAFVIALERKVIPAIMTNQQFDQVRALKYSLFRICTTLSSGWFMEFAQENYPQILATDVDYVAKFRQALTDGKIRPVR